MEAKEKMLDDAYKLYPRKEGKYTGMQTLLRVIKTAEDYESLIAGITHFAKVIEMEGTEKCYIPLFSTFCNQRRWLDYIDIEPNSNEALVASKKWF